MIVGVDFGAPQRARDQRRKIIAMAAQATGWRSYRVEATGLNQRLVANEPPGWSAQELVDELLARPARVVVFDFPFCVPHTLLHDTKFASDIGYKNGAFLGWREFSSFVAQWLPLTDPLNFAPFAPWRDRAERARLWTKRATDVAAYGQPPLKDKFQATFQMTLLGNALLSRLWESQPSAPPNTSNFPRRKRKTRSCLGRAGSVNREFAGTYQWLPVCPSALTVLKARRWRVNQRNRETERKNRTAQAHVITIFVGLAVSALRARTDHSALMR